MFQLNSPALITFYVNSLTGTKPIKTDYVTAIR